MSGRPPDARTFALFYDALDRKTAEREAWLAEACDDTAVREEVTAMLTHYQTENGPLDRPIFARTSGGALSGNEASGADDPRIGQRVGVWRITGLLGRGGMGSVYRATRDDGAYEQQAAIKLGHPGMRPDFRARFLQERAVLADLDHPGIARLLDGGLAPDGAPFLAMEVVDGQPLTAYADAHALGLRQRLALFVDACEAVAYAHRSLVVHRDLKPDHILVAEGKGASGKRQEGDETHISPEASGAETGLPLRPSPTPLFPREPRVKLLDFGVAKLLAHEADVLTRTGMGPLTPAYAAPEQFLGRAITTATDVYALGVVLYELLTGHRPYEVSTLTAAQAERVVCETAPARPSAVASGARPSGALAGAPLPSTAASGGARAPASPEARALRGDLDTICLKALAKEPGRRYPSAEALADDIRRYLDGLPVLARPATPVYHASRFVQRHRMGVASGVAALLLAVGTVTYYTMRLRAERDRAEAASIEAREETDRAEAVSDFLEQILRAPNTRWYNEAEATGPDTPVRAVLDEAALRVDRDFADRPDLRADLHHVLGDTYAALGLFEEGERHHLRTLALRESLYTPPDPRLAEALYYVAATMDNSDGWNRIRMYERAAAMQRARPEGNNFPFILSDLASFYVILGRYTEAAALQTEGLAFVQSRFVPGHDGYRYRDRMLALIAQDRSRVLSELGDFDGAARSLSFADSILARMPRLATQYNAWRTQMCSLGTLRLRQRRLAEAEGPLLACADIAPPRTPVSPFPRPQTTNPIDSDQLLQTASMALVALYDAQGRAPEAAPYRDAAARALATRDTFRTSFGAGPASRR